MLRTPRPRLILIILLSHLYGKYLFNSRMQSLGRRLVATKVKQRTRWPRSWWVTGGKAGRRLLVGSVIAQVVAEPRIAAFIWRSGVVAQEIF